MPEWIPRITAETSTAEVIENPSALNPYPERVLDGSFEVGENYRMPTFGANFHVYVKYGDSDPLRGQLPIFHDVTLADMEPPAEPDEAYEQRWQGPETIANATFKPVAELIDKEAPHLAKSWLYKQERDEVKGLMRTLLEKNQGSTSREYARFILETHSELIASGKPGAALAMANMLKRDRVFADGEYRRIYGIDTLQDFIIPRLLEPGFRNSPDELVPNGSDTEKLELYSLNDNIGRQALSLFELTLEQAAVAAARDHVDNAEVSRKMTLLEADMEKQSLQLVGGLHRIAQKIPDFLLSGQGVDLTTISHKELSSHLLTHLLTETPQN